MPGNILLLVSLIRNIYDQIAIQNSHWQRKTTLSRMLRGPESILPEPNIVSLFKYMYNFIHLFWKALC